MEKEQVVTVTKASGPEDTPNIVTWMYVVLVILIIYSAYNIWWNWTNTYTGIAMTGGQMLAWIINLIVFFGAIIGIFLVYSGSLGCGRQGVFNIFPGQQVTYKAPMGKRTVY